MDGEYEQVLTASGLSPLDDLAGLSLEDCEPSLPIEQGSILRQAMGLAGSRKILKTCGRSRARLAARE